MVSFAGGGSFAEQIRTYAEINRYRTRESVIDKNEGELIENPASSAGPFLPAFRKIDQNTLQVDLMPYFLPGFNWEDKNHVLINYKEDQGAIVMDSFEIATFRGVQLEDVALGKSGYFSRLSHRFANGKEEPKVITLLSYSYLRGNKFHWQGNFHIACYRMLELDLASGNVEWIRRVPNMKNGQERYLYGLSDSYGEVDALKQFPLNYPVRTKQSTIDQVLRIPGVLHEPDLTGLNLEKIFPNEDEIYNLRRLGSNNAPSIRILRESLVKC